MLIYILLFVLVALVVTFGTIDIIQQRTISRLRKEAANRPIGRIVSSELTKDGLLMKGEIWDDKVWGQISGDLPGMSVGPYSMGVDHAKLYTHPGGEEIDLNFNKE